MPSRAACLAAAVVAVVCLPGCNGGKAVVFRDRGVEFHYPEGWWVTGFSRTVFPARLVVASFRVARADVEGNCGGSHALAAVPRDGAAVLLIDYGKAPASLDFPSRPRHILLRDLTRGNYECFGESYLLRFRVAGHNLQAHLTLGEDASGSTRRQALRILESLRATRLSRRSPTLEDVEDRIARVGVEASRREQGGADVASPERVAAAAVRNAEPLCLPEGMDGEPPRALEPALVPRSRERLEEREAVA